MKRILVTGAAGFIGSHLVDSLLIQDNEVIGIDNLSNGKMENLSGAIKNPNFNFQKTDILDRDSMRDVMSGVDVVFHLACLGVRHSIHSPFENHRVNAEGTLITLEVARHHGVQKFFYISTSEIYGKTDLFPISETNITKPLTVYGSSKLAGEHYTNSFHECYNMDVTVLRIFNNYGPRAHYEGDSGEIIPRSIVRGLYGENPVIFGDGLITRDFYFVKDTARLLSGLLDNQNINGETINIGTGEEITMKLLLEKIVKMMPNQNVKLDYLAPRPADVPRLWVDNSKMKKLIGSANNTILDVGLQETIEYYTDLSKGKNLLDEIQLLNWTGESN